MKRLALLGFVALISGNAVFADDEQCSDAGSAASTASTKAESSKKDEGKAADLLTEKK